MAARGTLRAMEPAARPLARALGLGPLLVQRAAAEQVPWIAGSVVEGPALALGALQRAGRVVDLDAAQTSGVRVYHRATTGTAVYIDGRAVLWTLALPSVDCLAPDAGPRSLVNRNVRGFLKGFRRAGAAAAYFGREWIAVGHRPAAILGLDVTREGAVLLEVFAGLDAPLAIPTALSSAAERAVDRFRGKDPVALGPEVRAAASAAWIAGEVIEGVAAWAARALEAAAPPEGAAVAEVRCADDPLPAGFSTGLLSRVPIGYLETAVDPVSRRIWLGGDVLAPVLVIQAIARAACGGKALGFSPDQVPLEGATVDDLVAAARAAATVGAPPSDEA